VCFGAGGYVCTAHMTAVCAEIAKVSTNGSWGWCQSGQHHAGWLPLTGGCSWDSSPAHALLRYASSTAVHAWLSYISATDHNTIQHGTYAVHLHLQHPHLCTPAAILPLLKL
jgi:hypothetical protein